MAQPSLQEMLAGLIGTPSMSSVSPQFDTSNQAITELLASWLEDLGFATEIQPTGVAGKFNVIGVMGRGDGGLVLAGHTDTVPFDADDWNTDPFRLHEADGRYYGLGISDMKSFFGLALEAVQRFRASDLKQPLILLGTADEESSMSGGKALVAAGKPRARAAIVGEPTALRPVRMHKGIFMEGIRVRGHAGHSSDPSLGRNALEGMHKALAALLEFRTEMQQRHRNTAFKVPVPTLNFGHIHGGDNPNRICPDCELHIDFRTLPGMDIQAVRDELHARVAGALNGSGFRVEFNALFEGVDALETPATATIVRAAEELTGHAAESVAFTTEGPYLQALGADTVILGPGNIAQAHQPDEYLALDTIRPYVDILEQLIGRFCVKV